MRRPIVAKILVAAGLVMAGFMALGLPGFLVIEAAMVLVGSVSAAQLGGDQVWPAALMISLLGPFVLLPVDVVVRPLGLRRRNRVLLTGLAVIVVVVVATAVGIVVAAPTPPGDAARSEIRR